MKKSVSWMKSTEDEMLNQFNVFTMKLPGYATKYGLSAGQTTAIRNDYLWLAYAITCTRQFQQEAQNRAMWKNHSQPSHRNAWKMWKTWAFREFLILWDGAGGAFAHQDSRSSIKSMVWSTFPMGRQWNFLGIVSGLGTIPATANSERERRVESRESGHGLSA